MNHLVHSFGKPEDYKEWPKGWSHADLLPYFKKVFDVMNVMSSPEEEHLAEAFLMAEESLMLTNATLQKGMYTAKSGSRWSTFHAYLQNAWNRRNLHILTYTLVSQVRFLSEMLFIFIRSISFKFQHFYFYSYFLLYHSMCMLEGTHSRILFLKRSCKFSDTL